MMLDPAFKKLTRKVVGLGGKGMKGILDGIINFSILGAF